MIQFDGPDFVRRVERWTYSDLVGATFPGLPLLRVSSDVVWTLIAEATIARQNNASAVAVVERAILAVPIHITCA
jgi:hypothetical protein